ncbi:MAG: hypothetical protein QNJ35_10550 [Paracoccaceae bacterium]|nr:hypothetical protein [Paracoccaceae bacterium]
MDMLHLVPAALLSTIGMWFLWPVIVDPILRRRRHIRTQSLEATDALAEDLFQNWSDLDAEDARRT